MNKVLVFDNTLRKYHIYMYKIQLFQDLCSTLILFRKYLVNYYKVSSLYMKKNVAPKLS